MKKPNISLKQAQADPKAMKQFIEEQADLEVEGERFERVMQSMTGQGKRSVGREGDILDDGDGYT